MFNLIANKMFIDRLLKKFNVCHNKLFLMQSECKIPLFIRTSIVVIHDATASSQGRFLTENHALPSCPLN